MTLPNYTRVVLLTDKYIEEGVSYGAIGYVIEVYGDQDYEVEFPDSDGITTIAQIVVNQEEVAIAGKNAP